MGFKGEARSLILELIEVDTLYSLLRLFGGDTVNLPPKI
jgi:hypothetical protein